MIASLFAVVLLVPCEHEFALEVTAAIDGAVTPVSGMNGTFVQGSVGPGAAARVVIDDSFWLEAWTAVGIEVIDMQLSPVLREARLGPYGRIHGSVSGGWRFTLVDGMSLGLGIGPSVDTFPFVSFDTFGVIFNTGVMPVAAMRWRMWSDFHLDVRAATNIAFSRGLNGNVMASVGASWTFQ